MSEKDKHCTRFDQESDKRFMCDVYGIDRKQAYERALRITGCYYKNKDDLSCRRIGFLAQEVANYFPEAITVDENGKYSLRYDELVPILFQALKYQDDTITSIKEQLDKPWWKRLFGK